jgi:hypothetical protein
MSTTPVFAASGFQLSGGHGSATASGHGAVAVASGGLHVGGANSGTIVTGSVNTGGGDFIGRDKVVTGVSGQDLHALFGTLLAAVTTHAPANVQVAAVAKVEEIKAEVAKGTKADDSKVAKLVDGLVGLVPGAVSAVVSTFATPLLGGIVGPVTKFVLEKITPT